MKRWFLIGGIIVVVLALVGWRLVQKKNSDAQATVAMKQRTTGPVSVSIAIAAPRPIAQTLDAVGSTEAPFTVKVSPKIQGLITYLQVREGDNVKAGQTLVKLDPDTTTATIAQNESNYAEALQNYTKTKITQNSTDIGLRTAIGQAKATVRTAQANLNVVVQNAAAQLASAKAAVTDANAKISQDNAGVASAEASIQSAQATLRNAQSTLNRDLELYKQNYIAAQSVDDQKTAVDVAAAQVNVAQKQLDAANQVVHSATEERNEAQFAYDIVVKQTNATIEVNRAALNSAEEALKAAKANLAQSPAYAENLKALESAAKAAKGTLDVSKTQLNDTNLFSPVDGTVVTRSADPGTIAQPGTPVLTIEFMKWVYFNASIPVESSSLIYQGQPATITLDSLPGRTFRGKIAQVDRAADPTTHQFVILVKIDNSDGAIRTAMFGHVDIVTNFVSAAVTVPREAVTTNPDLTTSVMVVDSTNTAHSRTVKIGASDALGYQIVDGLNAGDRVVTLSYNPLKDGRKVEVKAISHPTKGGFSVDQLVMTPGKGGNGAGAANAGGATPAPGPAGGGPSPAQTPSISTSPTAGGAGPPGRSSSSDTKSSGGASLK